jgi:hypothetical protein
VSERRTYKVAEAARESGRSKWAIRHDLEHGIIEGTDLHAGKPGWQYAKWRLPARTVKKLKGQLLESGSVS